MRSRSKSERAQPGSSATLGLVPMAGGTLRSALALVAFAAILGGCGSSQAGRTPDISKLPLVPGAQVARQIRVCDNGASPYCGYELVVVDSHYKTSAALVAAEHKQLIAHGWSGANADTGDERAADSPGHKLRVTYATAYGDLKGIAFGWIKRSQSTALALSRTMFERSSAMSVLLEVGSG